MAGFFFVALLAFQRAFAELFYILDEPFGLGDGDCTRVLHYNGKPYTTRGDLSRLPDFRPLNQIQFKETDAINIAYCKDDSDMVFPAELQPLKIDLAYRLAEDTYIVSCIIPDSKNKDLEGTGLSWVTPEETRFAHDGSESTGEVNSWIHNVLTAYFWVNNYPPKADELKEQHPQPAVSVTTKAPNMEQKPEATYLEKSPQVPYPEQQVAYKQENSEGTHPEHPVDHSNIMRDPIFIAWNSVILALLVGNIIWLTVLTMIVKKQHKQETPTVASGYTLPVYGKSMHQ